MDLPPQINHKEKLADSLLLCKIESELPWREKKKIPKKENGDCTTVATQPRQPTLLQQFIKKKKRNEKGSGEKGLFFFFLWIPLRASTRY